MTAPPIVQPDIEQWAWDNLAHLAGVTVFSYAAVQRSRIGWDYSHSLQLDSRARRKKDARDLAEHVRQVIIGLPEVPWAEGVITYVQPVEGPFWLPDDDGAPRYCMRAEIRVRPRRSPDSPGPEPGHAERPSAAANRRETAP
jgi:hypothetical protein